MVNTGTSDSLYRGIDKIMDIERYSNITKLLRVTAYVIRFADNLNKRVQKQCQENLSKELKISETLWIKSVQTAAFVDELSFLNRKNSKSTPPIRVAQFGLFLSEDQTIRCKGRIFNAPLSTSCKSPILLPAKHTFVKLVIKQTHDRVKHSGINATLTALRERYWVLRGRETVKRVVRHCVVCRRYAASPCKPAQFPDLPGNRVSDDPPFTHLGLDFAGPLYVKEARRSSQESDSGSNKVNVCLFTCASTRAVHLELTQGLNVKTSY